MPTDLRAVPPEPAIQDRIRAARALAADYDRQVEAVMRGGGEPDWQRWSATLAGALTTVASLADDAYQHAAATAGRNRELAGLLEIAMTAIEAASEENTDGN
jgi:hypothetical protein